VADDRWIELSAPRLAEDDAGGGLNCRNTAVSLRQLSRKLSLPFRQLKGREITARLTGMEPTDDVHWALVFDKGGRLNSFSMGKASKGSWKVEKDELCLDRKPDEPRCYEVWMSGRNVQLRYQPALPEAGILQEPQPRQ